MKELLRKQESQMEETARCRKVTQSCKTVKRSSYILELQNRFWGLIVYDASRSLDEKQPS